MNKKPKTKALTLKRETVLQLTSDMMLQVAGGMIKETKMSNCDSNCNLC